MRLLLRTPARSPLFSLAVICLPVLFMVMLFLASRETGPFFSGRDSSSSASFVVASSVSSARLFAYAGLSKGKFLVAGGNMADPRFSEAVIFLVGHGPDGAMGLVINRPTKARLSEAFPDLDGLKKRTDTLFLGGPVRMDQLFMLIRSSVKPEDSSHVIKEVYVSGSRALLKKMIDKGESAKRVRVFAGYAGWGAQQLEREVARGDWYVMEADAESIFEKEPSNVWPELFRRGSAKWVKTGAGIFCPVI